MRDFRHTFRTNSLHARYRLLGRLRAAPVNTPEGELAREATARRGAWAFAVTEHARARSLAPPVWGCTQGAARTWARREAGRTTDVAGRRWISAQLEQRPTLRLLRRQRERGPAVGHLPRAREVPQKALRAWLAARSGTGPWAGAVAHYHATGSDRCLWCKTGAAESTAHHLLDCTITAACRADWWRDAEVQARTLPHVANAEALLDELFDADSPAWPQHVQYVGAAAAARRRALTALPQPLRQPWGTGRRGRRRQP